MSGTTRSESDKQGEQEPTTVFLLAQVGAQAGIRWGERLLEYGLTPAQVGILFMLAKSEGVNQRFLADQLGVVPSRLVVLADELEGAGLIERGANAPDRRTHAINLTDAGRAMLISIGDVLREHDEAFLAALSEEEQFQLRGFLEKIAEQEELSPGVHPGYRLLSPRKK